VEKLDPNSTPFSQKKSFAHIFRKRRDHDNKLGLLRPSFQLLRKTSQAERPNVFLPSDTSGYSRLKSNVVESLLDSLPQRQRLNSCTFEPNKRWIIDDCCDLVDLSYNNRTQVNFNVNTVDSKADIVLA